MQPEPDAVAEFVYEEDGREIVLTETITARRDREFLGGTYESKWGTVVILNLFESTKDGRTRWSSNSNHRFKGLMKFLSLFMAKSIRERIDNDMQRFKLLIETEVARGQS